MSQGAQGRSHTITVVLLAAAVLVALVITTGVGFPGFSAGTSSPTGVLPSVAPVASAGATATGPPPPRVHGLVTVKTQHLGDRTWRFTYTVRNTGTTPIAGFQLNGPRSNLSHIQGRPGWRSFGSGVCGGRYPGFLIYWSTGKTSRTLLPPHRTARFAFTVRTTGTRPLTYSLSWSSAQPSFGQIAGPAASSLPAAGRCNR